jgi:hypothetical protein
LDLVPVYQYSKPASGCANYATAPHQNSQRTASGRDQSIRKGIGYYAFITLSD